MNSVRTPDAQPLIEARALVKRFEVHRGFLSARRRGIVHAVEDVSLHIDRGETLGLVGESGSGKSTIGRMLVRLIEPTSGTIRLDGENLLAIDSNSNSGWRRDLQMVFQDPLSSLNPRMTVERIIAEPLTIQRWGSAEDRRGRVTELLELVGLSNTHLSRFPHEFSGGQRQRIGIARALASNPRFVVCDEPVSALDVSIQAQIVNLLKRLQQQLALSYLFIGHDISVVRFICNRVAVMYLGRLVEVGPRDLVFTEPAHPYTRALLAAAPVARPRRSEVLPVRIEGETPSPMNPPSGCVFRSRCTHAMSVCAEAFPPLQLMSDGRSVACHRYNGPGATLARAPLM